MTAVGAVAPESALTGPPVSGPVSSCVTVRGLVKRFGRRTALNGVDLTVGRGRITALLGPNAAGKSTLIKTVLGLVKPDAGVVTVDGSAVNGDPVYRARIGYMPQAPRFPENLTPRMLLTMLRDLRGPDADLDTTLLDQVAIGKDLDRPVRVLSGGTRQKLNAAIAFLFHPSLLILDEPTAGLDPIASGILKDHLQAAARAGATIVIASHVLSELEDLADDVVFLLEGTVRFAGPLQQLRQDTEEIRLERAIAKLMREHRP
jgi:Cu-processing system ATP-binding protein